MLIQICLMLSSQKIKSLNALSAVKQINKEHKFILYKKINNNRLVYVMIAV